MIAQAPVDFQNWPLGIGRHRRAKLDLAELWKRRQVGRESDMVFSVSPERDASPGLHTSLLLSKLLMIGIGSVANMMAIPGLLAFLEFSYMPAAAGSGV